MSDLSQAARNTYLFNKSNRINSYVYTFLIARDARPRNYAMLSELPVILKVACEPPILFMIRSRLINPDPNRPISTQLCHH